MIFHDLYFISFLLKWIKRLENTETAINSNKFIYGINDLTCLTHELFAKFYVLSVFCP